jgi:translation initiation factor IF-1
MRFLNINVLIGDRVEVVVSSCGKRGRIVYRLKKQQLE